MKFIQTNNIFNFIKLIIVKINLIMIKIKFENRIDKIDKLFKLIKKISLNKITVFNKKMKNKQIEDFDLFNNKNFNILKRDNNLIIIDQKKKFKRFKIKNIILKLKFKFVSTLVSKKYVFQLLIINNILKKNI